MLHKLEHGQNRPMYGRTQTKGVQANKDIRNRNEQRIKNLLKGVTYVTSGRAWLKPTKGRADINQRCRGP